MHDLLILLPGITGSVLRRTDTNSDLWAISGQALWQMLKSHTKELQQLRVAPHDPRKPPPQTHIAATELINDFHGVFGLGGIDGYDTTLQSIADAFDVVAGTPDDKNDRANLIAFPYDWRLSNRAAAAHLAVFVERRLPAFRAITGNPGAKVLLVAHSMGGLVSRYYLEVLRGWTTCRALITFGTPYRGAVNALNFLANGYKNVLVDLTEIMRSMPGVYELLPYYEALRVGTEWKRPADVAVLPDDTFGYAQAALDFHATIAAHIAANSNDAAYLKSRYPIFPVVGIGQTTLNSAVFESGGVVASELRPSWVPQELDGGDGTVPRISASPEDRKDDLREVFFAERHGSLQRNVHILTNLIARLQQIQAPHLWKPAQGGTEVLAAPIGLDVQPLYLPQEPVVLRVDAEGIAPFGALRGRITGRAGTKLDKQVGFVRQDGRWVAEAGELAAGQYRVGVDVVPGGPGAPIPVHDVFEVAG